MKQIIPGIIGASLLFAILAISGVIELNTPGISKKEKAIEKVQDYIEEEIAIEAERMRPDIADNQPGILPPVSTKSSEYSISLSKHLRKVGAVLYSAYWAPFSHEQLQLFGASAANNLQVIECAPGGKNEQSLKCRDEEIENYPTWILPGHKLKGVISLKELAEVSGYNN